MPDLQTALIKAITNWDDEPPITKERAMTQSTQMVQVDNTIPATPTMTQADKPQYFKPTSNISRTTFEFVRDNPGRHYRDVEKAMEAMGMNARSVSSLLSQMVQQGLIIKRGGHGVGTYYATTQTYTPIKSISTRKKIEAKRLAVEKRQSKKETTGIAALTPAPAPAPVPTPAPAPALVKEAPRATMVMFRTEPVADILARLSVVQARALYDALKKIFGG